MAQGNDPVTFFVCVKIILKRLVIVFIVRNKTAPKQISKRPRSFSVDTVDN